MIAFNRYQGLIYTGLAERVLHQSKLLTKVGPCAVDKAYLNNLLKPKIGLGTTHCLGSIEL